MDKRPVQVYSLRMAVMLTGRRNEKTRQDSAAKKKRRLSQKEKAIATKRGKRLAAIEVLKVEGNLEG